MTERSAVLFMTRAVDFPVPLRSCSVLSLSYKFFPQFPYLSFVIRRQAGSVCRSWLSKQIRRGIDFSKFLMMRREFCLVRLTTNGHPPSRGTTAWTVAAWLRIMRSSIRVAWTHRWLKSCSRKTSHLKSKRLPGEFSKFLIGILSVFPPENLFDCFLRRERHGTLRDRAAAYHHICHGPSV